MSTEGQLAEQSEGRLDDADDMRGFHLRRLLGRTLTWVLIGVLVIAAAAGGGALLGPVFIAVGAVAALLIGLLVVFILADSAAEQSFFEAYSTERGMQLSGKGSLPPVTPLLRKGDDRYGERILSGPLAEGLDGVLALYTYEQTSTDSEGNRQTSYYRFTVGMCEVPECTERVPLLYCRRKSGLKALEKVEDAFRKTERVKLESGALDDRYEIFVDPGQDQVWLRRLFSPTFIVWLTESAPEKFAFELVGGQLCCFVKGHKKSAADLDRVRSASADVGRRLRDEATE